jgi:hypothetical protein
MKLNYKSHFVHGFSETNIPFNKELFSEFKYGNICNAKIMANEMFNYFKSTLLNNYNNNDIIIYSSPYDKIPTSSLFLTKYLCELLSIEFPKINIKLDKIDRINTYAEDYGLLSAQERFNLISNDTYSLNKNPSNNALLIFIDDISITGTHQIVIENLVKTLEFKNKILFFYYAKLIDNSNPKIESYLNNYKIKSGDDLYNLMTTPCFEFTTRSIKYVLSLNNNDFLNFIKNFNHNNIEKLSELINLAISNKYEQIASYKENLDKLIELQFFYLIDKNYFKNNN